MLTLDHVGQGLKRSVTASQDGSLAPIVVKQSIHRLLQHSLLITNDDLRRIQVDQLPQTVVPVDDATIEVIQVTGREVTRDDQLPHVPTRERRSFLRTYLRT